MMSERENEFSYFYTLLSSRIYFSHTFNSNRKKNLYQSQFLCQYAIYTDT